MKIRFSHQPFINSFFLVLSLFAAPAIGGQTRPEASAAKFDVVRYAAQVEPDVAAKTIVGKVSISLVALAERLDAVEFDCGELTVTAARENGAAREFAQGSRRLTILFPQSIKKDEQREIEIEYRGTPRFGIRFFPERQQVYTQFSTSQWLVCVDAPDDRAAFDLKLILPANWRAVGNGEAVKTRRLTNGKIVHEWRQETPVSTYLFGFAAGDFRELVEKRKINNRILRLRYLHGADFSDAELRRIFRDTADMIEFYERRAGVKFDGSVYTQVLAAGGVEQEMSGFTAMRESYGRERLKDERAVWLGAHELAHQWWGNRVTNRDWTHFWLNEGIANFMTAAYKEHRFGRAEYLREIENYQTAYERVRAAGKDKSLVFPDWKRPTREDRTLVYDKGAYVVHLLREELGERAFWAGIKNYTRKFWGKSVVTADFQKEMETASGKSLSDFFGKWIYLTVP